MKDYMWLIISLFMVFGCQDGQKSKENTSMKKEIVFNCLIYPTGNPSDTYLVELTDDGNMITTLGTKPIDKNDFTKITATKSKALSTSELDSFLNLKNKILKMKEIQRGQVKKGGWEIILTIKGKTYHFYNGDMKNTSLEEVIKLIKKVSPVELDLHGWS